MKNVLLLVLMGLLAVSCKEPSPAESEVTRDFVTVEGMQFKIGDQPYYFVGTNFWYGAYLGMEGEAGDRERLLKELDLLKEIGVDNLRILAASEGARHKNALKPAFQESPGQISDSLMVGLDFLLAEMAKRDMRAVVFLNNFWEWSGGMNMYSEWFGDGPALNPSETNDWTGFMNHSAKFYQNEEAQRAFRDYITKVIQRVNSISGVAYNEDPTIMSWQLANEPRPGDREYGHEHVDAWVQWTHQTAAYIKSIAPKQLVSSGNEGTKGSLESMDYFIRAHDTPHIDYLTFHMWAKNWGWYKADNPETTFPSALDSAKKYIEDHVAVAKQLNKPITMEEFGLGRDGERFDPNQTTRYRDEYLSTVFKQIEDGMKSGSPLVGTNFWAWGGYGQAGSSDYQWRPGDPFTGDPPQEPQGLNSVFAADSTTLKVIRDHSAFIKAQFNKK